MSLKKILFMKAPFAVFFVFGVFALGILLIKLFWKWTIPELFPGAVAQGMIAAGISWWAALKLSALVALLAAITNISRN